MLVGIEAVALSLITSISVAATAQEPSPNSVLQFSARSIDGEEVDLDRYKGEVLLIVNTASQCGYTPQYKGLQNIYESYKDQGFQVLAFPANEFGGQEPGTNAEIGAFCTRRFHVSFPLFAKIVVKGQGKHPLYQFLTSKKTNPKFGGEIPWNFTKFLVDRNGKVIARFEPMDEPESSEITGSIENALAEKK